MDGRAVTALVLGIISIWFWPLGILLGPIALGLGIASVRAKPPRRGRGLAVAGIATGAVGLALSVLLISIFVVLITNIPSFDQSGEVRSVQAWPGSRNLDADPARELVVEVIAWGDPSRGDRPLAVDGNATVVVERLSAGTWVEMAQRSLTIESRDIRHGRSATAAFPEVELAESETYRVQVHLVVRATGETYRDETPPWSPGDIPDA